MNCRLLYALNPLQLRRISFLILHYDWIITRRPLYLLKEANVLSGNLKANLDVDITNYKKLYTILYVSQWCQEDAQSPGKNIFGDVKEDNLEKEFYHKFNKEIPVWSKINEIQKMSNEEAIQYYKYDRSTNILGELEEVSYKES